MKLKVFNSISEGDYEYWGKGSLSWRLEFEDGTIKSTTISAGEPEDNCFYRDLNGAHSIEDLIELAYWAGRRGEVFQKETIKEDE